ncbi:WXG100 family type VII secretion target [Streptomyces sp. SKN60]|uniref:WXG100 family type VII secretion target n=1 Tax=Streptomyces TaxID=1883 RepID=UPI00224826BC|nr:WXG100 family type VII secretion target [Streptomyces sp. SKN60]MCX2184284.1 WXG100 family type VII secretion target [Streptomyces sp. SKN60]
MPSSDDHISVDFATLQGMAGDLEEILKTLNEQLDLLYRRVEKVVLTWDGEARQTFVDQLDKWDRSAQDLQAAQAWLHDIVVNGHLAYAAAHRAVLRGWGAA